MKAPFDNFRDHFQKEAMEEVCQRFPFIAQKILNHIDNETLINFKEANRNSAAFLEKERFYWIRIIQRYNCLIGELQEACTANILLVKKATFPYLFFPILFQCIKGSENNVKLIQE